MSWTHLRDEKPVGRKDHRCGVCDEVIHKGTKHVARTGIDDEGPVTFRMHLECEEFTRDWTDEWEMVFPGEISREEIISHNARTIRETLKVAEVEEPKI